MKFYVIYGVDSGVVSHPARGAWIEMAFSARNLSIVLSHPARGAWIEIYAHQHGLEDTKSHPARGAWIEMRIRCWRRTLSSVAPRKGCVD